MRRPTTDLRERLIKASLREMSKRIDRRHAGRDYGKSVRNQNAAFPSSPPLPFETDIVYTEFGGMLDLVTAPTATLRKFRQLVEPSGRSVGPKRIHVNLRDLKQIEPASILFLAARTHQLFTRGLHYIYGDFPRNAQVFQVLREAGFLDFVLGQPTPASPGALPVACYDRMRDETNRSVRPQAALKVKTFLTKRHTTLSVQEADLIYSAVAECLENIRSHAYKAEARRRSGWYLCGYYDAAQQKSSFAVLDVGLGIIDAIKRRGGPLPSDETLLDEATRGLRTESGQAHRGKGLKWMREFAEAAPNRVFHVLCNGLMASFSQAGSQLRRIRRFDGTLLRFEMCR